MRPEHVVAAFAIALLPGVAYAQDAATLYKKGVAAMDAGKLAQACPLLDKSYEKEPRLPTLFAVAQCEMKLNKASSALEHFKAYIERVNGASPSDQQKEADRKHQAEQQIEELEKSVPELTFLMPQNSPDGTIVKIDGRVAPFLSNMRVPPGEHTVTLEMPDGQKSEVKVIAAAGDHKKVQLELPGQPKDAPAATPPAEAPKPEPAPAAQEKPKEEKPPSKPIPMVPVIIAGTLGVAGLTVGSVFGVMAMKKANIVDAHCNDVLCDTEGKKAADQGKVLGWVSTGAFAVGVIGVGAAVYFLVSGGGDSSTASASASSSRAWKPLVAGVERGEGGWIGVRRAF